MEVDFIGKDAVKQLIEQSKLTRFKIFKEGDPRGRTPVYEYMDGKQNASCVNDFSRWATNILRANPHNNKVYEVLLWNKQGGNDAEPEEEEAGKKRDKMRFSFSLTNPHGYPAINETVSGDSDHAKPLTEEQVSGMITRTLEGIEEQRSNNEVFKRLGEIEEKIGTHNTEVVEEEEEEDETDYTDIVVGIHGILDRLNIGKSTQVAGDEDDGIESVDYEEIDEFEDDDDFLDDDGDDDEEEFRKTQVAADDGARKRRQEEKLERVNQAVRVLWKHDKNIDANLLKLAKIAQKKPKTFKKLINKLNLI